MANSTANVTTGMPAVAGAIYYGATTATLPTDAVTAVDSAFSSVGFISEDGVEESFQPDVTETKEWGGKTVHSAQKERPNTFKFKMIEALNTTVLKAVYGDSNVSGDFATGITVKRNNTQLTEHAWIIDMVIDNGVSRIVIPKGVITDLSSITYSGDDVIGYEVTVSGHPDANGEYSYFYAKKSAS